MAPAPPWAVVGALAACLFAPAGGFSLGLLQLGRRGSWSAACSRPSLRDVGALRLAPHGIACGQRWARGAAAAVLSAAAGQGRAGAGREGTRPGFTVVEELRVPAPLPALGPELLDSEGLLRLPTALHALFPGSFPSITSAKKRVRRGEVLAEGPGAGGGGGLLELETTSVVRGGERLLMQRRLQPGLFPQGSAPFEMPVIYEDDHCAVVEKPPGVVTHKEKGEHARNTVKTALAFLLAPSKADDPLRRPAPCHRLDGVTGGLLVAAKTKRGIRGICAQFEERSVGKFYEAIVGGELPAEGEVDLPLGGKPASSGFRVLRAVPSLKYGTVTHVQLRPHTGRTHQLRRHMAHGLDAPIIGDKRYTGDRWAPEGCGLLLWATRIEFTHPVDGRKMVFESEPWPKFAAFLRREEARYNKFYAPPEPEQGSVEKL